MIFVFDADVLSTFAKINKLELFPKIFGTNELLVPPAVVDDLKRSKSQSVKDIVNSKLFTHTNLNNNELGLVKKIIIQKNLGRGEIECIAICKLRNANLVTNDNKAINFAENEGIDVIDLETILYSLKDILGINELKQLIDNIEAKDRVIIINKEEITKEGDNMKIQIKKPSEEEIKEMESQRIWEKEISEFPWEYNDKETCLILEGKAEVTTESGEKVSFGKGDFVVFPKGLKCTWKITEPIKKCYRFG